jgi:formate-dependent nitrite reductase membrane component NrfD
MSVPRAGLRRSKQGEVVPHAEVRTYYDRPVIAEPVWKPEVPWYFWAGGCAGASALLAAFADGRGESELARRARAVAAVAGAAGPPLLIVDLGVPSRFLNMLRVLKVTSPLSVGSWVLVAFAPAAVGSAVLDEVGRLRPVQRVAQWTAAGLGPLMATYTAALVANTAVPVWHDARAELPFVFAGSAGAAAGAAVAMLTSPGQARAARRLAVAGAVLELGASQVMERRLGELAEPYHGGAAGRFEKAAKAATLAGAAVMAATGRRRAGALAGGTLLLAGSLAKRWAVFRAGFQSARDPRYTVGPQRERADQRDDSSAAYSVSPGPNASATTGAPGGS